MEQVPVTWPSMTRHRLVATTGVWLEQLPATVKILCKVGEDSSMLAPRSQLRTSIRII